MGYLSEGLKNLKILGEVHLNLSGDAQIISDEGLEMVIKSFGRLEKLEEVSISFMGCGRITKRGQRKAQKALREERFPPLKEIQLRSVEETRMTESEKRKKRVRIIFRLGLFLLFVWIIVMYFLHPN